MEVTDEFRQPMWNSLNLSHVFTCVPAAGIVHVLPVSVQDLIKMLEKLRTDSEDCALIGACNR